jgi:hypothetical protein
MVYYDVPLGTQKQNVSAPQIRNNFAQANDSFGVDHYNFADETVNNGFHNKVTTPGYISSPPTVPVAPPVTVANPIFYGFQPLDNAGVPTTNLGLLQYSRGPNNAVPTPVTSLQSPVAGQSLAANTPDPIFDFDGISHAIATFYAVGNNGVDRTVEYLINWTGAVLIVLPIPVGGGLTATAAGTVLQLSSTAPATNVYWTLRFHRIG